MPCILYCVARLNSDVIKDVAGVGDEPVRSQELSGLRVYWSEIADPETVLAEGSARKGAELKYQQVLRQIVAQTTPLPLPFPVVLADPDGLVKYVADVREHLDEALTRLGDTVQYEMIASWTADDQADLATPVSGREYLNRRQESEGRIAAIDAKLRKVGAGCVREWRARQDRRKHHWFALVARNDRESFVSALRSAGQTEGVRLRLSGPWPPSEFVTVPETGES